MPVAFPSRGRRAVATLVALLAGSFAAPAAASAAVRVVSWNIAGSPTNARVKAGLPFDPAAVATVIRRTRPDVVGLQEVCGWQATALAGTLGYAVWHVSAITGFADDRPGAAGRCDYGNALLVRPPLTLDERVVTPLVDPGSCKADARTVAQARLPECRVLQTGVLNPGGVHVANVHVGVDATAPAQLRRLVRRAAELTVPAVLLGDDNVQPDRAGLAPRLAARGFLDAAGALPGLPCGDTSGCAPTFPSGGAFGAPLLRADYVWHSGTRARRGAGRVDTTAAGVPASDHLALFADLRPVVGPSGGLAVTPRILRNLRQFGLPVTVGTAGAAAVTVTLAATPKTVRTLGLSRGTPVLATATAGRTSAGHVRLALKPPPAAARALARARDPGRFTLSTTLTDVEGRRTRLPTRTITLHAVRPVAP
ncbi:hypothetical protein DSM112329_04480 [Paraconexibacter sp. AEG42_29]|uniref:Endonuclease/exonuclease/phosphatase domain-containing protein n=1 Tax=Paraconexibacter sp. AEG42_29 TaxID=2997339 RepID=A0AAU7B137_9ACTN